MLLKKTCVSFAGHTFSLTFEKQKLFSLFINSLNGCNLSLISITFENKSISSLTDLKSLYKAGKDFLITTSDVDSFLRFYGEFHNRYNSEKENSSSSSLCNV